MLVYVLSKRGKPLMPCKPQRARKLLESGKARVVRRTPFTIKLKFGSSGYVQPVVAGMDTGSKVLGCAAIANGAVVYQAEVKLRGDVSKKMMQRAAYRRTRRSRKVRYRQPRFLNRANSKRGGRLAPSIRSKIESHLREKSFVESILPVSQWNVETASFDIHKITNPDVQGKGYQDGNQKGYYNTKAYVLDRDGYKCRSGRKVKHSKKLQVHHLVPRANGGANAPGNLLTLCETCHAALHDGEFSLTGRRPRTKPASEMGVIKSQLKKRWEFEETFGYETKFKREQVLGLPKSHANDAIAICCVDGEIIESASIGLLKRHVPSGDYRQTNGKHSQKRIPTGKLFGLRKFDLVKTAKGVGFVVGKRTAGYFEVATLSGQIIGHSVNVKVGCKRLRSRATTLVTENGISSHT